ncbi:MAG: LPS assembly protein LptD [Kiritimatiellia bacterium]
MRTTTSALFLLACSCALHAQLLQDLEQFDKDSQRPVAPGSNGLKVTGTYVSASKLTGELLATGNVQATSSPYRFFSDRIERTPGPAGIHTLGGKTTMSSCTNELDHLHWYLSARSPFSCIADGSFTYEEGRSVQIRNAWLYWHNLPVAWLPYWYYPLNTDYGWRFMPGYTSRWGGYFLSGYVYDIVNEGQEGKASLGGSTYADYRTKNGFGLGQTIRWGLKDFGKGKVSLYNAWDNDYDRYENHWDSGRHHYRNWGSEVDRRRYRVSLDHAADFTERDSFRTHVTYLSDSHFLNDFDLRNLRNESIPANEMWYEHRELSWAGGASVSGPVNDFYGGTARLPEAWVNVMPQPIWDLPVNYESQTRAGYLNRDYAKYGNAESDMFRYKPYIGYNGRGADYQAFRADTYHRISIPFKFWDVLSFVPRASYRGTFWSDSGDEEAGYTKASGDAMYRNIAEFGFTLAARGSGIIDDNWRHVVEPYLDYSYQIVDLSSGSGKRYYMFDNYDRSVDWLDQFGFEGRGLPYNWHGIRPGLRNIFQRTDENGFLRSVLDADIYAAIPFEQVDYLKEGYLAGYPDDDEDGNYSTSHRNQVVPGTRIRFHPSRQITFTTRAEYDCQNEKVAYADIHMVHRLADNFSYTVGYIGRDHRLWDYLPSEYDRYNYEYSNILSFGFRHQICDWLAWSPYLRYDCRYNEVDEVGAWFDYLTDCLGYRFQFEHETSYRRIDGSKHDCDNRIVFFIYLRALGTSSMLDLAKF